MAAMRALTDASAPPTPRFGDRWITSRRLAGPPEEMYASRAFCPSSVSPREVRTYRSNGHVSSGSDTLKPNVATVGTMITHGRFTRSGTFGYTVSSGTAVWIVAL